jgi:hypothetical protein
VLRLSPWPPAHSSWSGISIVSLTPISFPLVGRLDPCMLGTVRSGVAIATVSDFSTLLSQLPIMVARACGAWALVASRDVFACVIRGSRPVLRSLGLLASR